MLTATVILFILVVIIDLVHYGAMVFFLRKLRGNEWVKPETDFTPKAAVLLTMRGADPFLSRCIEGLLTQDYPNYVVRLIVDHSGDTSLPIARRVIDKLGAVNVEVLVVDEHFSTCTLKCNSLYHAAETLDPSFEAVVILDADTNPQKDWLRRLVEPLSDPRFPAATGQRWYIPNKPNCGSIVRYLWNAAAVVQMCLYQMAWGGSMALRRDLFTKGNLLEYWKTAFTDDCSIAPAVKELNGKTAFVPTLFMVNRESCSLGSFHRWVKRQLLCAKLHHPAWNAIAAQSVLITVPLLLCVAALVTGLIRRDIPVTMWSLASIGIYWCGVFGTLPFMEHGIRRILRERGETIKRWSVGQTLFTLALIPVTQIIYTSAMVLLHVTRRFGWRGVEYDIDGKNVRLIEYKPYTTKTEDELQSL
ncbi:ceramide glucosyltransferase [Planctomycetales bacterium]|nr:ceramide glucosyltransferase [Planctomycetales bacterium]